MSYRALSLLTLTLGACAVDDRVEYYSGSAPSIGGLSASSELGNLGGSPLTINGSGFGADLGEVVVQVGSLNAEILSVSDSAIEIITPRGPIEGGAVDVSVATAGGQTAQLDAYTYDVGTVYDDQDAYILVNNFWYSCLGGRDDLGVNQGCETISYVGNTGIDGYAEFFDFAFPRKHSTNYGWFGGADWSPGEWSIQTPAYRPFAVGVDDLRLTLDNFSLHNSVLENTGWCADTTPLGSWYYGGSDEFDAHNYTSDGSLLDAVTDSQIGCDPAAGHRYYSLADLKFCEVAEFEENHSNDYQADWPIGMPFFIPVGEGVSDTADWETRLNSCRDGVDNDNDGRDGYGADGLDPDCHPKIRVDLPEAGLNGVEVTLPEPVRFTATQGMVGTDGLEDIWPLLGFETCFDDNGDGSTELSDVAIRLEWTPSGFEPTTANTLVKQVDTHVRFSLSVLTLGWFGGEAQPFRATITVPDDNNYDEGTGTASVDLPVDVFYQVPNIGLPAGLGGCEEVLGSLSCTWGDPAENEYGYLIVTADRVTEYRFDATELSGDLVLAYATGDFGFQEWTSPPSNGECGDCQDNDGDGWADDLDADCIMGEDGETGLFDGTGVFTCSDGLDNDGDGDIDAEDDDCADGTDRETNCGDGVDNDGDGWIDEDDGECEAADGLEEGLDDPAWTCTDGIDNDGDMWIDADDPGCGIGSDLEEDGALGNACNDMIDNDGHGDVDAEDPLCFTRGATYDTEEPSYSDECVDGVENENGDGVPGDLYVDLFDPDCEYSPYWRENASSHDVSTRPATTRCYDGLDNEDLDGDLNAVPNNLVDAEDPACWNFNAELGWEWIPDGFMDPDRRMDDGTCGDLQDNDGDGLIDLEDTENCAPGVYDPINGNITGKASEAN
ncbi:MAG: IPT/TIG domain-containing protein [Alphaproteobacteria bacterium]|nr:IPT/TIG domain-containing protein [Alphaproteobacteria bacterium]MCB9794410.1 IPT/TIG domain-containing protein [Alphaproteobacteria bacterium]